MFGNFKHYFSRWKESKNYRHDLDILLEQNDPHAPLHDRLLWTVHLVEWIRYHSSYQDYSEIKNVKIPSARLRFLFMILEKNTTWKTNAAKTLRSIIRDVNALELFTDIGLPREMGFWSEFSSRLTSKFMMERPLRESMGNLFLAMFPSSQDVEWLSSLDLQMMGKIVELFHYNVSDDEGAWNTLREEIEEALIYLVSPVRAAGLNPIIRSRMGNKKIREIPFYRLASDLEDLLTVRRTGQKEEFLEKCKEYRKLVWSCYNALQDVYRHLDDYGVNLKIVYLLEVTQAKLKRIDDLLVFMTDDHLDPEILLYIIMQLVQENQDRKSIRTLILQNTQLLARKIVDRSAKTGEHYITRNRIEYKKMFKKALGGGFYTSFAVYIKFAILSLKTAPFMEGVLASINYAICFLAIDFSNSTLATKQPAMTGPVLAQKMQNLDNGELLESLVDEIVYLMRTQIVGILGNIVSVLPLTFIFDQIWFYSFGHHLISVEKAHKVLDGTSILGFVPIYAAFTGVLLWASSVFAGWMDNWFVFNNMKSTVMFNRKLNFIFGRSFCERLSKFLERKNSAIAANVSLGILMGSMPVFFQFLGIHLEVRHVTLSSGSLGAAFSVLGMHGIMLKEVGLVFAGIFCIAVLNVTVSFTLALLVAIHSRNIRSIQREHIYRAIWKRFVKNPLSFVYPVDLKREKISEIKDQ